MASTVFLRQVSTCTTTTLPDDASDSAAAARPLSLRERLCSKSTLVQVLTLVLMCALVIAYAVLGAFIFVYLEKDNELQTRENAGETRKITLDELYNITGPLRHQIIVQEARLAYLRDRIAALSAAHRACAATRNNLAGFVSALARRCQGDNVALTDGKCQTHCLRNNVSADLCAALCARHDDDRPPCQRWQMADGEGESAHGHDDDFMWNAALSDAPSAPLRHGDETARAMKSREEQNDGIPEQEIESWAGSASSPDSLRGRRFARSSPSCASVTCVVDANSTLTVCFGLQNVSVVPSEPTTNVSWHDEWVRKAGVVLKRFEQLVIRKAKIEGYDGGDSEDATSVQWNFSGALLYSVTIITTIGYGNISPKTSYGRVVTMLYAIFGMPLFLIWVSQMGTLLAQFFQFSYTSILCLSDKRRAAPVAPAPVEPDAKVVHFLFSMSPSKAAHQPLDDTLRTTSSKLTFASNSKADSGRYSYSQPRSLDRSVQTNLSKPSSLKKSRSRVDLLEPEVKQVLQTCAVYNLRERVSGVEGSHSAEILEQIRHAEVMRAIRRADPHPTAKAPLFPPFPRGEDSPFDTPMSSPSPCSTLQTLDETATTGTTLSWQRARPDHESRFSPAFEVDKQPIILADVEETLPERAVKPYLSNELPKADPRAVKVREHKSSPKSPSAPPQGPDKNVVVVTQDRVPFLPVLVFVILYILMGAAIFSAWESWDFLEGAYFCFITLTTIGFGDFVPGDAVLNADSTHGAAKLILSCVYVLLGLAVVAMSINLMQEEMMGRLRKMAVDLGIVKEDDQQLAAQP